MNRKSCFGCIGLLLAAFTVPALAQTWQLTSGSGSFQSPSNWSPAEVPGVGDAAVFSVPGESTVTFAASAQNASATFGAASGIDVALDVGASTWSLNDLIYNNPATVRLNSGTLQVANGVTTLRGMILNGGSANFPGGLRAGAYQVNRLEIHGGSHACNDMTLYENANETDGFEMRMSGGTLANTEKMTLYGADVNLEGGDVTLNEINFYGSGPSSITVHTNASLIGTGTTPSIAMGRNGGTLSTLNIHGGVVSNVYLMAMGVTSSSTGVDSSVVLLDGGILRHDGSSSQASLINASVQRVALTTNGAVVQLQGYDCTIPAKLVNETGHAGAFTKLGPMRLTLSSPDSAFTGRITVAEGQLRVTGGVYLTGGVVVEDGAWLNLYDSGSAYATIHDARTASGTISRIDGTMTLAPAGALTCGDGAVVGGGGTLTGGLVVEAGGALGADKDGTGRALDVTGAVDFAAGAGVALTGYVSEALETPVAVLNAAGGIAVAAPLPVSLDGVVQPSLRADLNAEGTTLLVRFQPIGTVLCVR